MADPSALARPFVAFNFGVEATVPGLPRICGGAFSECDGLEMSLEVKTIREGGNNGKQLRLAGPAAFGTLTLKRGMTDSFDLWKWFARVLENPGLRADVRVVLYGPNAAEQTKPAARFELTGCIPVRLKGPPLNAKDGTIAVEEFQLAYESLRLATQERR